MSLIKVERTALAMSGSAGNEALPRLLGCLTSRMNSRDDEQGCQPEAEEENVSQVHNAGIRSDLRLEAVTPMEEVLSVRRREEQKRRWLEELDKQREETTERRRREKQLQSQPEDHQLWASHFDSLQRRPPVPAAAPTAPTPAPLEGLERREWEPTSRLSLLSEAVSTCGGESVRGAVVETNCGHSTRTSYLRTMTALLDPAQLEERDRRRIKQLEQQVEEKKQQREREDVMKKKKEEEEERRLSQEREMLRTKFELEILKEEQARRGQRDVQVKSSPCIYRDVAAQTTCGQHCGHQEVQPSTDEAHFTPTTTQSLTEDEVTSLKEVFCCLVCKGPLHQPMFSSCCRSLIGCKDCILKWNKRSNRCPKCRAVNLRDNIYEVTGLYEALAPLEKLFL